MEGRSGNGRWLRYERGTGSRYCRSGPSNDVRTRRSTDAGGCKIERTRDDDEYEEEIRCKRGLRRPAYDCQADFRALDPMMGLADDPGQPIA